MGVGIGTPDSGQEERGLGAAVDETTSASGRTGPRIRDTDKKGNGPREKGGTRKKSDTCEGDPGPYL